MAQSNTVSVDRTDGVARVVMDRPERHNAMDATMAEDLASTLDRLARDTDVRCLVLTGTDGVYNTGADLSTLEGDDRDERAIDEIATPLHESVRTLIRAPKPVMTGINGVVAGGGLGLALASDVAIMSTDARFEYAYPQIGLSGDGGITWFLPRLVGLRRAQSFALLGEGIGPREADDRDLVTETVDADEFEDRLATVSTTLADGPTRAFARIRKLFYESTDRSLDRHLVREKEYLTGLTHTSDYRTGIDAFGSEEDPAFEGC